jgi:Predicted dehydrogenase
MEDDTMINGEISFWYADMGGVPGYRPALPGDLSADVCIVGAGFTGLWTAYYLLKARPDLSVVLLEKEFAGLAPLAATAAGVRANSAGTAGNIWRAAPGTA